MSDEAKVPDLASDAAWPVLYLVRRGVVPDRDFLGWVVEIPPEPTHSSARQGWSLADPCAVSSALEAAFDESGLLARLAGVGQPARLVAWGIVEPSAWEQAVVTWVERRFERSATREPSPPPGANADAAINDVAASFVDPFKPLSIRPGAPVRLVEGRDVGLEALGVARLLRENLLARDPAEWPACWDAVEILLPSAGPRMEAWRRALERLGFPVVPSERRPLSETGAARWLVRLVDLAAWPHQELPRDILQVVLDSPFLSLPRGARRKDLREALRSLRRHEVGLDAWLYHVEGYFTTLARRRDDAGDDEPTDEVLAARRDALLNWSRKMAASLPAPASAGFFRQMHETVHALWKGHVRPGEAGEGAKAANLCLSALDEVAADGGADAEAAGLPPLRAVESRRRRLAEALASRSLGADETPRQGVHLDTYLTWDGTARDITVLAGLEEGGFPLAPARRSRADEAWAAALGLPDGAVELERQALIAAAAARSARALLVLSWSASDDAGSDTFPGSLLAALKADSPTPILAVDRITHEAALAPGEAVSPDEIVRTAYAAASGTVPDLEERWKLADGAAGHAASVASHRAIDGAPEAVGPYTGTVGVDLSARSVSATALETLGQCGAKFFFSRILGLESPEDAGVSLDPTEQGTWLHAVFAKCVDRFGGVWDLRAPSAEEDDGEARAEWKEKQKAAISDLLASEADAFLAANPTFSRALLDAIRERWRRVLDRWVDGLTARGNPGGSLDSFGPVDLTDPSDPKLDRLAALDEGVARALDAWRAALRDRPAALALLEATAMAPVTQAAAKEAAQKLAKGLLGIGDFAKAASAKDEAARREALADLRQNVEQVTSDRRDKWLWAAGDLLRRDQSALPLRAIGAEVDFGGIEAGPVRLDLDGLSLRVRGRIDRIDAPEGSATVSVVDYKTGKGKGDDALLKEVGQGLHLQLPLYGLALEQAGVSGLAGRVQSGLGALEFPRSGQVPKLAFRADDDPLFVSPGAEETLLNTRAVVRAHLRHAALCLRAGTFSLLPRSCPQNGGGAVPCDFSSVCGYATGLEDRVFEGDPQPLFAVKREKKKPGEEGEPPPKPVYEAALPPADIPDGPSGDRLQEQGLDRARDLGRDIVLVAGAGAGKTHALVERYLQALRNGRRPGEILCITFTRKAATEMRVRVRRRILESGGGDQAAKGWLRELGTAPILTFDAFARLLVTEFREEPPPLGVAQSAWIRDWVESRFVEEASSNQRLRELLGDLPPSALMASLTALLGAERWFDRLGDTSPAAILAQWLATADSLAPRLTNELEAFRRRLEATAEGQQESPKDEALRGSLTVWLDSVDSALAEDVPGRMLDALWAVWDGGVGKKKCDGAELAAVHADLIAWRNGWAGANVWFARARKGRPDDTDARTWIIGRLENEARITSNLVSLARDWLERLRADRRRRGWAFDDVANAALALVTKRRLPTWACTEGGASEDVSPAEFASRFPFHHILVDEFQDTDTRQLHLIEGVRDQIRAARNAEDGCRVFVVGDPKQSIYRFRGAEVDLFDAVVANAEARGDVAQLPVCRRSVPDLTRAIDRLFGRLLDGRAPGCTPLDPGATVSWQPMAPRLGSDVGPAIELVGLPPEIDTAEPAAPVPREDSDEEDGDAEVPDDLRLERALAGRLREIVVAEPTKRVAVLTHSWARAIHYASFLREQGLHAFVLGGSGLLELPEVAAVLGWLNALDRADDDLAWASMLRGPMVGVSDPGLYCLRYGYGLRLMNFETGELEPARPVNALSSLRFGFAFDAAEATRVLSEHTANGGLPQNIVSAVQSDQERLAAFGRAWAPARDRFGFVPMADVIGGIVRDTGYEAILARWRDGAEALANLDAFTGLVRATEDADDGAHPRLPRDVLRHLSDLLEAGEDPSVAGIAPCGAGGVLVTVVHQAKGLEWDVVAVPDLHKAAVKSRAAAGALVRFPAGALGADVGEAIVPCSQVEAEKDLFKTTAGIATSLIGDASRAAERAESRRLLYVACTRAKERLLLSAKWPDEASLQQLAKATGGFPLGLRHAASWMHDLVVALQMQAGAEGKLEVSKDVWIENVDFVWKREDCPATGFQAVHTTVTTALPADPERRRRASMLVTPATLRVVRPSTWGRDVTMPVPSVTKPAVGARWLRSHPLGSAAIEGTLTHRALQEWSYAGALDSRYIQAALQHELGAAVDPMLEAWMRALLDHALAEQPALVAELTRAAARRQVHHEARLSATLEAESQRVTGAIDLIFRDDAAQWRVLDYKTDQPEASLATFEKEHYGQVDLYRTALARLVPAIHVGRIGLWRLKGGEVVEW